MSVARADHVSFWPGRSGRPALDDVSLELAAGEVVLLEGPSGSGKSTLLRAFAGLVPHFHGGRFAGRVVVMGHDTRTTTPARLAGVVGSVFQDPETQAVRATVAPDVAFGLENTATDPAAIPDAVRSALRSAGALHLHDRSIASLSGGERQRVAIAGVLASGPRVLLLDEPTSQLDDRGVARLGDTIATLAAQGVAVLVAEHHADRLADVAHRTVVLDQGRVTDPRPIAVGARTPADPGPELLRLERVTAGYGNRTVLSEVSLTLTVGTVTALHGANGSGKSTLVRVIAGLHAPTGGRVMLDGRDIGAVAAEERFPDVGTLLQDAGRRLIRDRVADEIASAAWHLQPAARAALTSQVAADLDVTPLLERHPLDLSVGERERVALACVLVGGPRVIVLDEPSRGMDPVRRDMLTRAVRRRAADGAAVLLATHDASLAGRAADRHVELVEGRLIDARPRVPR